MVRLTIVVPCYNEEEVLPSYYDAMKPVMERLDAEAEILFVDDGSSDRTLELIKELSYRDDRVKYVSFTRNFGKEAALLAGLFHADGDLVAVMDSDGQDPPEMILEMYDRLTRTGADCVALRRKTRRGEPPIRTFFTRRFYHIINKLSKTEVVDGARDFRIMTRRMRDSILEMGERCRFSKGIFSWTGYRTEWIEYENVERIAGETKWSFFSLFVYALEGIMAFSAVPLAAPIILGSLMLIASFILLIMIIARAFTDGASSTLIISYVVMLTSGITTTCLGVVCGYLSKIYWEVKGRPIYIIKETSEKVEKASNVYSFTGAGDRA